MVLLKQNSHKKEFTRPSLVLLALLAELRASCTLSVSDMGLCRASLSLTLGSIVLELVYSWTCAVTVAAVPFPWTASVPLSSSLGHWSAYDGFCLVKELVNRWLLHVMPFTSTALFSRPSLALSSVTSALLWQIMCWVESDSIYLFIGVLGIWVLSTQYE